MIELPVRYDRVDKLHVNIEAVYNAALSSDMLPRHRIRSQTISLAISVTATKYILVEGHKLSRTTVLLV